MEVQQPGERPDKAEQHRRMARAAIRVAMAHGATSGELEAEYANIVALEEAANV